MTTQKTLTIRKLTLGIVALSAIALGGCKTVNSVEPDQKLAQRQVIIDERIEADSSLAKKAAVLDVIEGRVGNNDLLKIQVEVQNLKKKRKEINWKIEWVDNQGLFINSQMTRWSRLSLAGYETAYITAIAPTPQATDFRLKLIEPGS